MRGQKKPGARAGEKRKSRMPFAIDAMPEKTREEIQKRRAAGQTWQEISDASPSFAGRLLAVSVLQRWYDVRVEQVQREVLAQPEPSRALAAAFAGKGFEKLPEAVQAALSSAIFSLAEEQDEAGRAQFIKSMGDLAWLLARNRQLDQEERRLELEARKLETIVSKVQGLKKDVEKKKLSPAERARKVGEIYDIAPPA